MNLNWGRRKWRLLNEVCREREEIDVVEGCLRGTVCGAVGPTRRTQKAVIYDMV